MSSQTPKKQKKKTAGNSGPKASANKIRPRTEHGVYPFTAVTTVTFE